MQVLEQMRESAPEGMEVAPSPRRPDPAPLDWRTIDDATLVEGAILGEMAAFDELVRRFRPAVTAIAARIVGADSADDVAQDAMLLAFKALPQLDEPERFGAWLHAVTRHRALRFAQAPAQRLNQPASEADLLILEHTPALGAQPQDQVERDERAQEVRDAVAQLPEEFQLVILLHYFEGMPVARISDFLALPVTTVKWRLYRGRRILETTLAPQQPGGRGHEQEEGPRPARVSPNSNSDSSNGPDKGNRKGKSDVRVDGTAKGRAAAGASPAGADVAEHRQDGARRRAHRPASGWQDRGYPAVPRHPGALDRAGRGGRRPLSAPGGVCFV